MIAEAEGSMAAEEKIADTEVTVRFKTAKDVVLPKYESSGSAGADVRSNENCTIKSNGWGIVSTGLFPEIPEGYEIQIRSRSGLAAKSALFVLNSPGTIDSDYRGEIKIILANLSGEPFKIARGDRIAQLIVSPVKRANFVEVSVISPTPRGEKGLGSTGKR